MDAHEFAKKWMAAWNSHDLDVIMEHYAEDLEITTPMIKLAAGIESGSLQGKAAVTDYWRKALDRIPELHFELLEVTEGINSVALYYKSVMNKRAIEVMFFNAEGKVNRMYSLYT